MTGRDVMRELRKAMVGPDDSALNNKKLAIGRAVLSKNPDASVDDIRKAYHAVFDIDMTAMASASPEKRQELLDRREWIKNTMPKVDQICETGKYDPAELVLPEAIPVEDRPVMAEKFTERAQAARAKLEKPKGEGESIISDGSPPKPAGMPGDEALEELRLRETLKGMHDRPVRDDRDKVADAEMPAVKESLKDEPGVKNIEPPPLMTNPGVRDVDPPKYTGRKKYAD